MRYLNGAITETIDPKLYYSRFSFLESSKDAIDLKYSRSKRNLLVGTSLPQLKNKFYARSTLIKNLIPLPSEGKVRAMFGVENSITLPKINKFASVTSRSPEKNQISKDVYGNLYHSESKHLRNISPTQSVIGNKYDPTPSLSTIQKP